MSNELPRAPKRCVALMKTPDGLVRIDDGDILEEYQRPFDAEGVEFIIRLKESGWWISRFSEGVLVPDAEQITEREAIGWQVDYLRPFRSEVLNRLPRAIDVRPAEVSADEMAGDVAKVGTGIATENRSDPERARRPCYDRDQTFLKWQEEALGPAAIRDRWNAEHEDQVVGKGAAGREVVKKGIRQALKDREADGGK